MRKEDGNDSVWSLVRKADKWLNKITALMRMNKKTM